MCVVATLYMTGSCIASLNTSTDAIAVLWTLLCYAITLCSLLHNAWLDIVGVYNVDMIEDAVADRTSKASRGDADTPELPFRPGHHLRRNLCLCLVEVNSWIQILHASAWWNQPCFEGQHGFENACECGRTIGMLQVRFDRSDQQTIIRSIRPP